MHNQMEETADQTRDLHCTDREADPKVPQDLILSGSFCQSSLLWKMDIKH